ncbi:MAG: hypothetical protein KKD11_03300 [Candidatus Omnitrophica bacterium]|nr:hypothetical protein [Candidatus Omnitrophota bacterium]
MTEKEFWQFMERSWNEKGRAAQISGGIDSADPALQAHGQHISGHALLPNGYDEMSDEKILRIGELLFDRKANPRTKEAIMVILAHIPSKVALSILREYNARPDKGLEIFAEIALDECEMWNE